LRRKYMTPRVLVRTQKRDSAENFN
jgi:hypothetical protein